MDILGEGGYSPFESSASFTCEEIKEAELSNIAVEGRVSAMMGCIEYCWLKAQTKHAPKQ